MIRRPPRSTPFPTRRSSDLAIRAWATRAAKASSPVRLGAAAAGRSGSDRKSTRLNSSHSQNSYYVFFFNDPATPEIYTFPYTTLFRSSHPRLGDPCGEGIEPGETRRGRGRPFRFRSEEHTSELQSQSKLLLRLFF